jgi:hypothetical protein
LRNLVALREVVAMVDELYAQSVAWEESAVDWQRGFSHVHRHAGNEMVAAVGRICVGRDKARVLMGEQRAVCYERQNQALANV